MKELLGPLRNLLDLDPGDVRNYNRKFPPFKDNKSYELIGEVIDRMKPVLLEAK